MNCLHCNKPIQAQRNTKKFCTNTCKQYAYLQRAGIFTIQKEDVIPSLTNAQKTTQHNDTLHQLPNNTMPIHYKRIQPRILTLLKSKNEGIEYKKTHYSTSKTGIINRDNIHAFSFVCRRTTCIIENVLRLQYKYKVHYNTINCLVKAMVELLKSPLYESIHKQLEFNVVLLDLFNKLFELESVLKDSKEGIKFILAENKIILYINVLRMLRGYITQAPSFKTLFPHLCTTKH